MKVSQTTFQSVGRFVALGVLVLTLVPSLQARRGDDDDRDEITRLVTLTRTEAAPEGARGVAKLEVGHRGDPTSRRIELDTFNLAPGTYTVTVFDAAGASAVLGTFTAGNDDDDDNSNGDRGRGRNRGSGSSGSGSDEDSGRRGGGGSDNDEGEADFALPDSVNALGLTTIVVTDAGGVDVLLGDFSDASTVQSGRLFSRAPLIGTEAAPDVSGRVEVRGHQRRGKNNGQFRLEARGLPASTAVVLNLDGTDVVTATTDRRGRLRIRRSARELNIFSVSTVSLRDEAGTELARAQF